MEIISLDDLFEFIPGVTKLPKNYKDNGKVFLINYKDVLMSSLIWEPNQMITIYENLDYTKHITRYNDLLITSTSEIQSEIGQISIYKSNKSALLNGFCKIMRLKLNNKLNPQYAFYLFKTDIFRKKISNCSNGITRYNILWNLFKKISFKLVNIEYQLDIIAIIEPFEKLNNQIHKLIQKLKYIYFKIINNFSDSIGFMKDNQILFEKGINFHEAMLSENEDIPFINVSAINNNINKFIKSDYMDKVNTEIGDVILSLDGNPGLVNNFLWGINGYGYKVISKNNNFLNYQIYFSLLSRINQIIIEKNATGTTIKHATKAKNKLIIFTFNKWNEILELIFFYEIKLKEILNLSNKIINKLIKLFVI